MQDPTREDIQRALDANVEAGVFEERQPGRYALTSSGREFVSRLLKTDRAARQFYREMNILHGRPVEDGLPDWQGHGDEFHDPANEDTQPIPLDEVDVFDDVQTVRRAFSLDDLGYLPVKRVEMFLRMAENNIEEAIKMARGYIARTKEIKEELRR